MTEEVFKAPRTKRIHTKSESEQWGSPIKRHRTKDDFFTFCTMVLAYTEYEHQNQEDLRVQNNTSPLDSGGSNAESDSAFSSISTMSSHETSRNRNLESDDEAQDLITCYCMKPYAGRPMIECSECETWIHLSCAKIRKANIPDTFVCQECRDAKFTKRKSSRTMFESKRLTP